MLFEQHPYFVQRGSRVSGYRRPCSSRVWPASRAGTLPSFFRAACRLYRSSTVHQCWCSTWTVDSFSSLILALFATHILRLYAILVFSENRKVCSLVLGSVFRFCFSPFVRARQPPVIQGISDTANKLLIRGARRYVPRVCSVSCKHVLCCCTVELLS